MIVCRRCAIVNTVHSLNFCRIMRWMKLSVSASIDAVASSITKIFGLRKIARPMQINCR
eukprot:gene10430-gene11278